MSNAKAPGRGDHSHHAFNRKIIDRIARDPQFGSDLLKDAEQALRAAGLDGELRELEELDRQNELSARECAPLSCVRSCNLTCKTNTCLFTTSC